MVEDRRTFELTESIAEAERLFIEDFDTCDMAGYYLYSKYWRAGVSAHIGTGGIELLRRHFKITATDPTATLAALSWHLMRAHVPYFMPPARATGRPRRQTATFPLLRAMLKGRSDGRVKLSADKIYELFADRLKVDPETVEREYRKWIKAAGKITTE
jgi:hypothetical protein